MTSKIVSLSLGLAVLAGMGLPALAHDRGAPGIRVVNSGVPVPAPVPIPDMPSLWYISIGAGYAVTSSGSIKTDGPDIRAYDSFGDNEGPLSFGFAAGRRFWGNWRGEVDFTFRPKQKISKPNTTGYNATALQETGTFTSALGVTVPTYTATTYAIQRDEEGRAANQTAMLNLYYDIPTGSIFTPYVGGGIGLVVRQTVREFKENGQCTSTTSNIYTDPDTNVANPGTVNACTGQTVAAEGSKQNTGYGFAAALMAGLATEVARGVTFDIGYRFLWQDAGASIGLPPAVGPESILRYDARTDHEVRASLRFAID
jgi:opacity protein-like surface antigen